MPNVIDANGYQMQTIAEIISELENGAVSFPGLYQIYGPNIVLDPNSPDGNWMNLIAQTKIDVLEFGNTIYTSMDPDQAFGTTLDDRVAINGITRLASTYTQQAVAITSTGAVTLPGLDLYPSNPFTVADGQGNQYQLLNTYSFTGAATTSLSFEAANLGPVQSAPNTITTIVTITVNITAANNPSGPGLVGVNGETDAALRQRRANSVEQPSQGYLQGLLAGLYAIDGVTNAIVLVNPSGTTDGNGVPGHSIWAIVAAANTPTLQDEIAQAIYIHRGMTAGMKGSQSVPITQVDGSTFNILFDFPTAENLWIRATLTALYGTLNKPWVQQQVFNEFSAAYNINQPADASAVVAYIKQIAPNASVSLEGVSNDGSSYVDLLDPTAVQYQFVIPTLSNVTIS